MGPGINSLKARSVVGLVVMLWPVDNLGGQLARTPTCGFSRSHGHLHDVFLGF